MEDDEQYCQDFFYEMEDQYMRIMAVDLDN